MAKNDGGRRGGVDRDRDRIIPADDHVSDVAGAAVDGDRGGNGELAVVAAAEAVDLGHAALVDGALEGGAWGGLATGGGVAAVAGDPQRVLRMDRSCGNRQHQRAK